MTENGVMNGDSFIGTLTGTLMKQRKNTVGPATGLFYPDDPLVVLKASGQYLFDQHGNEYLDCISNVQHVGHAHKDIAKAVFKQMTETNCNSRFLHPSLTELTQSLLATLPEPIDKLYMCNSGSEANDLALRLSRDYTNADQVIVLDHAYHGHISAIIDISPYKFHGRGGKGKPDFVHIAPVPDVYRGKYRLSPSERKDPIKLREAGKKYAAEVQKICQDIQKSGKKLQAFFMEALMSCGGQIVTPPGYLEDVIKFVHEAGGLVVIDEVQTGFGRIGDKFWAFRLQDVCPDMVTMGKPMGNGFPVSAVAVKTEFGGNPVSCTAALTVLKILKEEKLSSTALEKGNILLKGLTGLMKKYPFVGDVRGVGLFAGIELIVAGSEDADGVGKPNKDLAEHTILEMRRAHRILMVDKLDKVFHDYHGKSEF